MTGAVKVSMGYQRAGYLGLRIGPYQLSREGQGTPLLEVDRQITAQIPPPSEKLTRAVPGEDYLSMRASLQSINDLVARSFAAAVKVSFLPKEMIDFLASARKNHELDLRFCSAAVFLPFLQENGEWSPGFEVSMAQPKADEVEEFLSKAPGLKGSAQDAIYINTLDEKGKVLVQDEIYWSFGRLLGRIKVKAMLIANGLPVDALSQNTKNVYSYLYLGDIYFGQLQASSSGKERLESQISRVVEQLTQPVRLVPDQEMDLLRSLLG